MRGVGIDPVGDGWMRDTQRARNAPQVHPIGVQPQRFLARSGIIALWLGFWSVIPPAPLTEVALAPGVVETNLDLSFGSLAIRTSNHALSLLKYPC